MTSQRMVDDFLMHCGLIDEEDFLAHYGVKGMKWGKKKSLSDKGKDILAKAKNNVNYTLARIGNYPLTSTESTRGSTTIRGLKGSSYTTTKTVKRINGQTYTVTGKGSTPAKAQAQAQAKADLRNAVSAKRLKLKYRK